MTPGGQISLFDARAELGRTGSISLLDAQVKMLGGNPAGQMGMFALRNSQWINHDNYPNPNAYSTPDGVNARVVLAPGVTVRGNSFDGYSLFVGVGNGSTVTFDNYGTILGAAGAPNSGAGGNALYTYCKDNVQAGRHGNLHVRNFGQILAGGGGGGAGGAGGYGGGGYYVQAGQDGDATTYSSDYYWAKWVVHYYAGGESNPPATAPGTSAEWAGSVVMTDPSLYGATAFNSGGYTYHLGNAYASGGGLSPGGQGS